MREKTKQLRNECRIVILESEIAPEDEVRIVDKIVECIDLQKVGYKDKERKSNAGCPKYGDKDMLKILIYGYRKGIHSGRKLEEACKNDLRFQWLVGGLKPDANTINDYRKEHIEEIKKIFYEVNRMFIKMGILKIKNYSQDGFKIKAVNSKEKNYTKNKVMDRIVREKKAIEDVKEEVKIALEKEQEKVEEYLKGMESEEEKEKIVQEFLQVQEELIKAKVELEEIIARKNKHEEMLKKMVDTKTSQISLTDPESKLMKNNGKFEVCYNNQTAVDMETHLTIAIDTDDNPADIGSMNSLGTIIKKEYGEGNVITNVTDKGYDSKADMVDCLEKGVIPQVTPKDKKIESIELETEYEEAEITEEEEKSTTGKDIKKCLRAGKIPESYKNVISNIRVEEVTKKVSEEEQGEKNEEATTEEITERAVREQIFLKDAHTGAVMCPMGEHLNPKSKRADGVIRYANKFACKNCKNPCTKSPYKEICMKENQTEVHPRNNLQAQAREIISQVRGKRKKVIKKVVKFELKLDPELLKKRMATSEHSQGTMKTVDNYSNYHMKGKKKVSGETALHFLSSNIRRVYNMYSFEKIVKMLEELATPQSFEQNLSFVHQVFVKFFLKKPIFG